jgi:hypothetical protein
MTDTYTAHLMDCTRTLLDEIAMPKSTPLAIAQTYSLALHSIHGTGTHTDWHAINQAIIARWSTKTLIWIKEQAWSSDCWRDRKRGKR